MTQTCPLLFFPACQVRMWHLVESPLHEKHSQKWIQRHFLLRVPNPIWTVLLPASLCQPSLKVWKWKPAAAWVTMGVVRKERTKSKCVLKLHIKHVIIKYSNFKLNPGTVRVNMKVSSRGERRSLFVRLLSGCRGSSVLVSLTSTVECLLLRCMWPERHGVTLDFLWKVEVILWHLDVKGGVSMHCDFKCPARHNPS